MNGKFIYSGVYTGTIIVPSHTVYTPVIRSYGDVS